DFPCDHRIAHDSHAVSVCDHHRPVKQARIFHPGGAGHLAVAVFGEPASENSFSRIPAPRKNCSDPGADWTHTNLQSSRITGNQGSLPDFDSLYVGNGVVAPGRSVKGNSQVASTRLGLSPQ